MSYSAICSSKVERHGLMRCCTGLVSSIMPQAEAMGWVQAGWIMRPSGQSPCLLLVLQCSPQSSRFHHLTHVHRAHMDACALAQPNSCRREGACSLHVDARRFR